MNKLKTDHHDEWRTNSFISSSIIKASIFDLDQN